MITFRRDEYFIRVRRKNDTYHTVIEIGSKSGCVRVGHLKTEKAQEFTEMLEYFTNGSDVIVIEERDDAGI